MTMTFKGGEGDERREEMVGVEREGRGIVGMTERGERVVDV